MRIEVGDFPAGTLSPFGASAGAGARLPACGQFAVGQTRQQRFCDDSTANGDELQKYRECARQQHRHCLSDSAKTYNTPATTFTVIAMMITLKKNETTLCSMTTRRNADDVIATSEVWQHMLRTMAK